MSPCPNRWHGQTPIAIGATTCDFATHWLMKNALESDELQGIAHHNQDRLLLLPAAGAFSHPDCTVGVGIPDIGPGTDSCIRAQWRTVARGLTGLAGMAACRITAGRELGVVSLTLPRRFATIHL